MAEPPAGDPPDYDAALPGAQTELAPSADETSAHTAWALDDGPEWKPPFWTPGRITAVAVTVAVLAVVVTAGIAGYHLRSDVPAASPASTTAPPVVQLPTTTTVPVATTTTTTEPPSKTVTVTTEAAKPVRPPVSSFWTPSMDAALLANLAAAGWPPSSFDPPQAIAKARYACATIDEEQLSYNEMVQRLSAQAAAEGADDPYRVADDMLTAAMYAYEPCWRR